MAKRYAFPSQPASESCPAIPKSIGVWGESLKEATDKLAEVLKSDPQLEQEHPELLEGQRPAKKKK